MAEPAGPPPAPEPVPHHVGAPLSRGADRGRAASPVRTLLRREVPVLAGALLLAVLRTGIWSDPGTRFYVGSDPIIDVWTLHWVASHLLTDPARVFDGNIFYPTHDTVLLSDPLLGLAALVQPLRLVSTDPVLAYNAAIVLSLALASWALFHLGLRLCHGDPLAALVPAVFVPYCAQQQAHIVHLNLLAITGFPVLLLGLVQLLERPGPRPALLAALGFAFEAATSGYHAFACTFLALTVAAWGWRRFRDPRLWLWAGLAAAAAGLLVAPFLAGFVRLQGDADLTRTVRDNLSMSLTAPGALLRTHAYAWRWLLGSTGGDSAFPGLVVPVLAVVALWRGWRQPAVRMLALVVAVFVVVSIGPRLVIGGHVLPMPYGLLLDWVPLLRAGRHPITFVIVALMALGLLAGIGLQRSGLTRRRGLAAALVLAAAAETFAPPVPRRDPGRVVPEAYARLPALGAEAILELPLDDPMQQWWATWRETPTANGVSPFAPTLWYALAQRISREWKREPAGSLEDTVSVSMLKRRWPVSHLVVHRRVREEVRRNLDLTPSFELVAQTAEGARVYRVHRGGTGALLQRAFRDEALRGRALVLTARAARPLTATARLRDAVVATFPLEPGWRTFRLAVPPGMIRRGLNEIALTAPAGEGEIELRDVGPEAP